MSQLLSLIGDIYDCVDDPNGWRNLLPKIARAVGGHAAAIQYQRGFNAPHCETAVSCEFDPAWLADYTANWDAGNEWRLRGAKHFARLDEASRLYVNHVSDMIAPEEFRRTPTFTRSLKSMDLYDAISLPLSMREAHLTWFIVFCGRKKDQFTGRDLGIAHTVYTHLFRAARFGAFRRLPLTWLDTSALLRNREARIEALRREYGLTQAEAEVAIDAAEGHAPLRIAQRRAVKLSTVRWQIRVIHEKLQVRNAAELTRRVLSVSGSSIVH